MSIDFSCATVNIIHVSKFKQRTIRKMLEKYSRNKPLILDTRVQSKIYIDGKLVCEIFKSGYVKGVCLYKDYVVLQQYKHPAQTIDAIEGIRKISPELATWLMFNFKDFFGD